MHQPIEQETLFSLVIATAGRGEPLRSCLTSLEREATMDFEILVMDQNEDDRVLQIVEEFRDRLPIEHFRYPVKNASLARNAGAMRSRGAWIGFPDDDCEFESTTLDAIRAHVRRGQVDLITGMIRDEQGTPVLLNWHTEECEITNRCLRQTAAESSLYVRREVFERVGGFDEVFGPGGLFYAEEGVDFIRRLWAQSGPRVKTLYSPAICFIHHNSSWYADEAGVRRARLYSLGRGALFARHWRQASVQRVLVETAKHIVGSVVLRGLRRRSRIESLMGNMEGFLKYHKWCRARRRALSLYLGNGSVAH